MGNIASASKVLLKPKNWQTNLNFKTSESFRRRNYIREKSFRPLTSFQKSQAIKTWMTPSAHFKPQCTEEEIQEELSYLCKYHTSMSSTKKRKFSYTKNLVGARSRENNTFEASKFRFWEPKAIKSNVFPPKNHVVEKNCSTKMLSWVLLRRLWKFVPVDHRGSETWASQKPPNKKNKGNSTTRTDP